MSIFSIFSHRIFPLRTSSSRGCLRAGSCAPCLPRGFARAGGAARASSGRLRACSGELRPLAFPAAVPVPWTAAVFLDAVDRRRCQLPVAKNRPTEFATSPWCCRAALLALSWTGARDRELPVRYPRASPGGVRVLGPAHRRPGPAPRAPRPCSPSG